VPDFGELPLILSVASAIQADVRVHGLAARSVAKTDVLGIVRDPELRAVVAQLYEDGYYALAVEEGCKFLNNLVKRRAKEPTLDGARLMNRALSPDNPVLRLNSLATQSDRDEQLGYMQILAGLMTGVRNPRAHEHSFLDSADGAFELLGLLNHLVQAIRSAASAS
jgi:uncharacterized protein (TIGR02391 family)